MKPIKSLLALLILALAGPAAATVLVPLDVDDLARLAPLVLVGEVNSVESRFNDDKTKIYTYVQVTPSEVLKGSSDRATVTIKTIGGRVGDTVAELAGAPRFSVGERVVVFLEPRRAGDGYLTLGLYQGKFELIREPRTGRQLAIRRAPARGVKLAGDSSAGPRDLVVTLADIRAAVRRAGGGQ